MKRTLSLQRSGSFSLARGRLVVALMGAAFFCAECFGQGLYPDWVRTYHYDLAKTNQALKCLLTSDGLIVAGSSASPFGDSDYLVIKYGFDGAEAWVQRYGSAPLAQDSLRAMAIDPAGNIFVTGTSDTVKYDPKGNMVWHAPYGGRAIVANADFAYVTGFSEVDFATAQLTNGNGGVGWVRTYNGAGNDEDTSTAIILTKSGDVVVAGGETLFFDRGYPHAVPTAVRYSPTGTVQWVGKGSQLTSPGYTQVNDVAIDFDEDVYLLGPEGIYPVVVRLNSDGTHAWTQGAGFAEPTQMRLTPDENLVVTGSVRSPSHPAIGERTRTMSFVWINVIDASTTDNANLRATEIARDGHIYTAGDVAPNPVNHDILLLKLNADGTKVAQALYDNQNHLADIAQSLAIDAQGNAYVTGYSATPEGGTEFLTIKFVPDAALRSNPDGTMHVEFRSTPGQPYAIQATTDFFNWRSVITNTADANGHIQFDDTNTTSIPYRFYRGNPNP